MMVNLTTVRKIKYVVEYAKLPRHRWKTRCICTVIVSKSFLSEGSFYSVGGLFGCFFGFVGLVLFFVWLVLFGVCFFCFGGILLLLFRVFCLVIWVFVLFRFVCLFLAVGFLLLFLTEKTSTQKFVCTLGSSIIFHSWLKIMDLLYHL